MKIPSTTYHSTYRTKGETPHAFKERENLSIKIQEVWSQDSEKMVLALGSLVHRTYHAWGNLPENVSKNFGAKFVNIDYPKIGYDSQKVTKQILQYLSDEHNKNVKEIIICGLSFWELAARDLITNLPAKIKEKVVGHISLNGVSDIHDLSIFQKPFVKPILPLIKTKLFSTLVKAVGEIDRSKPTEGIFSKKILTQGTEKRIEEKEKTGKKADLEYVQSVKRHQKAAKIGITQGLAERIGRIFNEKDTPVGITDIPVVAIYSTNDATYTDPQKSAKKIKKISSNEKSCTYKLVNAHHAALVELPKKYDTALIEIIGELWQKNKIKQLQPNPNLSNSA